MKLIKNAYKELFPNIYYSKLLKNIKHLYREERKKNKEKNNQESYYNEHLEIEMLEYEWNEINSDKMIKIARRYDLIIPNIFDNNQITDFWDQSGFETYSLNSKGRNYIKKQYQEEIKWKREKLSLVFSFFIGLVGSLTGLIAILSK